MLLTIGSRLLLIFDGIYTTKSVSKTANLLGIGQPAISSGLNKLREHFADPLFVRIGNTMEPTQAAKEIEPLIRKALDSLQQVNEFKKEFDPIHSTHCFKISILDISYPAVIPSLINYIKEFAPHVTLEFLPIDIQTPINMANGDIDLTIGFIPQFEAGFYQQTLFKQTYSVLCSVNHPRLTGDTISLDQYVCEEHIEVSPMGTGHYIVQNTLFKKNIHRHIIAKLSSYFGTGSIIQNSEFIMTAPNKLCEHLTRHSHIKPLTPLFNLPSFEVKQYWHERKHSDPNIKWLRSVCFRLFNRYTKND